MAINKNFVIKNGVEVNTNLLVGDSTLNKVGIATTVPGYTLHVGVGGGARGGGGGAHHGGRSLARLRARRRADRDRGRRTVALCGARRRRRPR